jgi:hypothetical protein
MARSYTHVILMTNGICAEPTLPSAKIPAQRRERS